VPNGIDIEQLRAAIARQGARWQVKDYAAMDQALSAISRGLGVNETWIRLRLPEIAREPDPDINQVINEFRRARGRPPQAALATIRPSSVDWRNHNGISYVTRIKDQGNCGSCVGFCITGLLESMVLREHGVNSNLSEADLFFCGGANCTDGWDPDNAINNVVSRGVCLEQCFPYPSPPQTVPCNACADRTAQAVKATQRTKFYNIDSRKQYLSDVGPMAAVMQVFEDFDAYSSGIYSHVSGASRGYHCVEVIGYDDNNSCWICKNSWGTGWGEQDFFRIAYGQCGIDSDTPLGPINFGSPFWGIAGTQLTDRERIRFWSGRFTGSIQNDLLAHPPESEVLDSNGVFVTGNYWWLGRFVSGQLNWSQVGNTVGLGMVADGRPIWTGNFSSADQTEVLFLDPGNHNWWLGIYDGQQIVWSLAGNTAGFGAAPVGCPTWVGDFNGDGKAEMLFFYPGDHNWWLGAYNGQQIVWSLAGNTAGFGAAPAGCPIWTGNFSTPNETQVLFLYPGDQNWWLGTYSGQQIVWSLAGNTAGFGTAPVGCPTWVGDFNADGKAEVLFYSPGDDNWWLGAHNGQQIIWSLAGNTAGFGHGINDGRPFWVGRFSTPTKSEILFFFPGDYNWWLGSYNGQQLVWTSAGNTSSFGPIADGRPFRIGDFNDDGKAEVLFYHPDDNAWQLGQWAGGTLHWNQVASTVGLWMLA
jgi:hypothetical protein